MFLSQAAPPSSAFEEIPLIRSRSARPTYSELPLNRPGQMIQLSFACLKQTAFFKHQSHVEIQVGLQEPRTPRTKSLEPYKKQLYQLYFTDNYTMVQVTEIFAWLFSMLYKANKAHIQATEHDWRSRLRQWNKEWKCRKKQSVGLLPAQSIPGDLWLKKGHHGLIILDKSLLSVWEEASARPKFITAVEYLDDSGQPRVMFSRSELAKNNEDSSLEISKATFSEKAVPDSLETIFPSLPYLPREGAISRTSEKPLLDMSVFTTLPKVVPARTNPIPSHFLAGATLSQSNTTAYYSPYSGPIADTIDPKKLMIDRCEAPDESRADCVSPRSRPLPLLFQNAPKIRGATTPSPTS
ncbi:MAG: hypothetical protein Q9191_008233 [Dirinaria sp. TL-2023a]